MPVCGGSGRGGASASARPAPATDKRTSAQATRVFMGDVQGDEKRGRSGLSENRPSGSTARSPPAALRPRRQEYFERAASRPVAAARSPSATSSPSSPYGW